MAVLSNRELMALRIALGVEADRLEAFVAAVSGPEARASYRERLDTVRGLIEKLAPGARVIVGD